MSNYDIVRDVCVRANPEIGESIYREGCQVFGVDCGEKDLGGRFLCRFCQRWGGQDRTEIVLRDIRLSDVLLAIRKANDDGLLEGKMGTCGISDLWGDASSVAVSEWALEHDSLEWHRDNAPEVIEWLAGLLTTSKEVRGLLCTRCNRGIGCFLDDITRLKNAIKYLS